LGLDSEKGCRMTKNQSDRADYYFRAAAKIAQEVVFSLSRGDHDRVVRKTQEAVELFLKGKLLQEGIEPTKSHDLRDLAGLLNDYAVPVDLSELEFLSEERIPSFYGGADFIPDQEYEQSDSDRCIPVLKKFGLLS